MEATLECRFLSPRRKEFGSLDTVADIHVTLRLGLRTINRMTRYGEQNASSMRTGNYPNASKFHDRNELYGNKQYVNEPNCIQENHWMNSLDGGHIFQATPINCQNKCLEQMWHLLALFKQG
jgi:hypothetical protein